MNEKKQGESKEMPSTFKAMLEKHTGSVIVNIGGKGERGKISRVYTDFAAVTLESVPYNLSGPCFVHFGAIAIPAPEADY